MLIIIIGLANMDDINPQKLTPLDTYYRIRGFREEGFRTTYIMANQDINFLREIYEAGCNFPPEFLKWDPKIPEDLKSLDSIIKAMERTH
jgi:hypothetical protein